MKNERAQDHGVYKCEVNNLTYMYSHTTLTEI